MSDDVVRLGDRRPASSVVHAPVEGLTMLGVYGDSDIGAVRNLLDHLVGLADGDASRVIITTITFGTEPDGPGREIAYGTFAVGPEPPRTGQG